MRDTYRKEEAYLRKRMRGMERVLKCKPKNLQPGTCECGMKFIATKPNQTECVWCMYK